MNNNSRDSIPSVNITDTEFTKPLLPRSCWNSQLVYLRLIFRAKKALDRLDKEAGIVKI